MASSTSPSPPPSSLRSSASYNPSEMSQQPPVNSAQTAESVQVRSFKPIPLNAAQEAEVRDIYYRRVRSYCSDQIRDFAHCAAGRTFSITWKCRPQRKAMETCMIGYATRAEEDAAREEWFMSVGERRRQKEKDEQWREDQRQLKREWWRDWEHERGVVRDANGNVVDGRDTLDR